MDEIQYRARYAYNNNFRGGAFLCSIGLLFVEYGVEVWLIRVLESRRLYSYRGN